MDSNRSRNFLIKRKKPSGNYYRKLKKFRALWKEGGNKENVVKAIPVYRCNATLGNISTSDDEIATHIGDNTINDSVLNEEEDQDICYYHEQPNQNRAGMDCNVFCESDEVENHASIDGEIAAEFNNDLVSAQSSSNYPYITLPIYYLNIAQLPIYCS